VARRKKEKKIYKYECTLTGEQFTLTEKAENPDDLMSIKAYYDMHQEDDDRPLDIKKKLGLLDADKAEKAEKAAALAAEKEE